MVGGNFVKERKKKITHTRNHPSNTNTDMANKKKKVASLFLNKNSNTYFQCGEESMGWVGSSLEANNARPQLSLYFFS